jgi:hypothetical protein
MSQSYFPLTPVGATFDESIPPTPIDTVSVLSSGQDAQNAYVNQRDR